MKIENMIFNFHGYYIFKFIPKSSEFRFNTALYELVSDIAAIIHTIKTDLLQDRF